MSKIQERIEELEKEYKTEGNKFFGCDRKIDYLKGEIKGIKFALEEVGDVIDKVFLKEYGKKWVNELKQRLGIK